LIKELLGWRRRRRARKSAERVAPVVEADAALGDVVNVTQPKAAAEEEPVIEVPVVVSRDSPPTRSLRPRKKIID
jgi:hypothetical protein